MKIVPVNKRLSLLLLGVLLGALTFVPSIQAEKAAVTAPTVAPDPIIGLGEANIRALDVEVRTNMPIDAVLVLDSSRSMQRTDPNRLRDQGAKLLGRFFSDGDRIAVFRFDENSEMVLDFTEITVDALSQFDSALDAIPNEGNWTNIHAPLEAASDFLRRHGRREAQKSIILLSDGIMDPHPKQGTAKELNSELLEDVLPKMRRLDIQLFTIALSDEADKELLSQYAEAADGSYWFAPDAKSIHHRFSDFFLSARKPQVLEPSMKGTYFFDQNIQETTLFIPHPPDVDTIEIRPPGARPVLASNAPADVQWFQGKMFDVITFHEPIPGEWFVRGVSPVEGFATIFSDIQLQAKWPTAKLKQGDQVLLVARVLEKSAVPTDAIRKSAKFTFQILNPSNALPILGGDLLDDGKGGDQVAEDNLYSAVVKLEEAGTFRAVITASAPKFIRQQIFPFTVLPGDVELRQGANPESGKDAFIIAVGSEALAMQGFKVELVAERVDNGERTLLPLKAVAERTGVFVGTGDSLSGGAYKIVARVMGVDNAGNKVTSLSSSLSYVSANPVGEEVDTEEDAESSSWLAGVLFVVCGLLWIGGIGYLIVRKKFQLLENGASSESPPEIQALKTRILQWKARTDSTPARAPTEGEREIFSLVSFVFETPEVLAEPTVEGTEVVSTENPAEESAEVPDTEVPSGGDTEGSEGVPTEETNPKDSAEAPPTDEEGKKEGES